MIRTNFVHTEWLLVYDQLLSQELLSKKPYHQQATKRKIQFHRYGSGPIKHDWHSWYPFRQFSHFFSILVGSFETRVISISNHLDPELFDYPVSLIKRGEVVAFPTETVYGLGANALDSNAVKKVRFVLHTFLIQRFLQPRGDLSIIHSLSTLVQRRCSCH